MVRKLLLITTIILVSCGSSKKITHHKTKRYTVDKRTNNTVGASNKKIKTVTKPNTVKSIKNLPPLAEKVIWTAVTYKGAPYRYGGVTIKGMDCSGLVYTSFKQRGVEVPRTSSGLYSKGTAISLQHVRKGDLIFFQTSGKKSKNSVNHVALVTSNINGDVKFIHATSSRGVIVSSITESYWKGNFVGAKRIIE